MTCYKTEMGGRPMRIIFFGRILETPGSLLKEYYLRGTDIWMSEEYGSMMKAAIDIKQIDPPGLTNADTNVKMNISVVVGDIIEIGTRDETFRIGEKGSGEHMYPMLQKKVDEHWGRIEKIVRMYVQNKEVIMDEDLELNLIWIRTISDEEKLCNRIHDVGEMYSDVFEDVILKMAKNIKKFRKEMEEEDRKLLEGS